MIFEKELCDRIVGCAIEVHKLLGSGFLEKVYQRALEIELKYSGLKCEVQRPLTVVYRNECVGEYFADLVVEDIVILELKSCSGIVPAHEAQLINYLAASNIQIGYILNFGNPVKLEFSRKVRGFSQCFRCSR